MRRKRCDGPCHGIWPKDDLLIVYTGAALPSGGGDPLYLCIFCAVPHVFALRDAARNAINQYTPVPTLDPLKEKA